MITLGTDIVTGEPVTQTETERTYHQVILGLPGQGKSQLMLGQIRQDMDAGRGMLVLDPHNTLVDATLAHVPAEREEDVILLDLEDEEYPFGFNLFHNPAVTTDTQIAGEVGLILAAMRNITPGWGSYIQLWLTNLSYAFLESGMGTLAEGLAFLHDGDYRQRVMARMRNGQVKQAIRSAEAKSRDGSIPHSQIDAAETRLFSFVNNPVLLNIVRQKETRLNWGAAIAGRKIVLCRFRCDSDEAQKLLGAMILGRLLKVAQKRPEGSELYPIYIDEWQNFAVPDLIKFIKETRKNGVPLVLATQSLYDPEISQDLRIGVLNADTKIFFKLNPADASQLAGLFSVPPGVPERPVPTARPVERLLAKGHPDPAVRHVVEHVLRPISRTVQEVGKHSVWAGVVGQLDRYFVELMEGRLAIGADEARVLLAPLTDLFYPFARDHAEAFWSYVRFACTLYQPLPDDIPAMQRLHRHLGSVRALGLPEPVYERLVTTVLSLRFLGRYLAEQPLSDATDDPTRTDVSAALKGLPRRHAALHHGDRTCTVRTLDIPRVKTNAALIDRIRVRCRQEYCAPADTDEDPPFFDEPAAPHHAKSPPHRPKIVWPD